MSKRQVKLLAVDLDGTLVDSAPDIAHCLGNALEAVGYTRPGEARTRMWIGDGLETLIARALVHASQPENAAAGSPTFATAEARQRGALEAFLACYGSNLFSRSRLYPQAIATLDELRGRGVRLCCITNKRYSFSEQLLAQAGILDRFELLLGGDSLPEKKPHPLPLNVAADKLGVAAASAALVGDSHQDLRAARAAGYAFVLASYGYGKIDETELADSPRIRKLAELPRALGL
ncbi:MAG: phosphoglycolate phosphatase [Gammaproteobacteria bacterium]